MKTLVLAAALLLLAAAPEAVRKPCDDLKSEIDAKLQAKGVKDYTLEIKPTEQDRLHARERKIAVPYILLSRTGPPVRVAPQNTQKTKSPSKPATAWCPAGEDGRRSASLAWAAPLIMSA